MQNSKDSKINLIRTAVFGSTLLLLAGCLDGNKENTAGLTDSRLKGFNEEVLAVEDAGNGTLYVGGHFSAFNRQPAQGIARVSKDGVLDKRFVTGKGFDNAVYAIAMTNDGNESLYVGGDFSRYNDMAANNIVRIKSDGSYDETFTSGKGFNSRVEVITPALDGSGDIYVGGHFTRYNGAETGRLIRLNRDGSIDERFKASEGANGIIHAIAAANDGSGDIYVAGDFTSYNGTALNHIARLNADGSVDKTFKPGSGFDREVFALALANDNSRDIYAGGWFHSYDGKPVAHLIRLTESGEVNNRFVPRLFDGEGDHYVTSLVTADNCSGAVYAGGSFSSYAGKEFNGLVLLNGKGGIDQRFPQSAIPDDALVNSMVADIRGDLYVGGWLTSDPLEQPNLILRLPDDRKRDFAYSEQRWQQPIESAWRSGQNISLAELVL